MISVEQNAGFGFVVEERAKVDPAYNVPASLELLFEPFLYVFSCVFKVWYFASDHLYVNVLSNEHGILFVFAFHVAKLDLG